VIMSKGTLDLGQSVRRGTAEHADEVASRESRVASEEPQTTSDPGPETDERSEEESP
jgi:hypothetical protein